MRTQQQVRYRTTL